MPDGTPAWAYAPVSLADPDPAWADLARVLAAELRTLLADALRSDVVHVGSTAVPGLRAKPVVDLMALVDDPAVRAEELSAARWFLVSPELDRRPWRRLLVRPTDDERHRLAHLHLMAPGTARWHEQIAFRDRLRARPDLAAEYARLKDALVASTDDREAYTRGKTAFVRRALELGVEG